MSNKISQNPSLSHASAILEICSPLKMLGINYFSHVHINNENQFSGMGLCPKFVKLYLEKEYYNFDIHMASSMFKEPYIIWDEMELTGETKELDQDYRDFGFGHTFTIIKENQMGKDFYHFGTKHGNSNINYIYLQNIHFLQQFINYFTDKLNQSKELSKGYELTFSLNHHKPGFAKDNRNEINKSLFAAATQINKIYLTKKSYLTRREIECLHWFSLGKTIEEASLIMNATPRTLKAHIRNIKDKLNCVSQFQLGMLCERYSWLISGLKVYD